MLSDEEKEAIEKIKRFNQYNWEMNNLKGKEFAKPYFESLDTLLNLIEKQSKEIEELKEGFKIQEHNYQVAMEEIEQRWKDKIKAKIEEEDKLFFKTKDVRHANRYKAYKELLEKE